MWSNSPAHLFSPSPQGRHEIRGKTGSWFVRFPLEDGDEDHPRADPLPRRLPHDGFVDSRGMITHSSSGSSVICQSKTRDRYFACALASMQSTTTVCTAAPWSLQFSVRARRAGPRRRKRAPVRLLPLSPNAELGTGAAFAVVRCRPVPRPLRSLPLCSRATNVACRSLTGARPQPVTQEPEPTHMSSSYGLAQTQMRLGVLVGEPTVV
jgi:hypothetical protein